ncbi:hypothetical protein TWF696_002455 [Orbilia brochopaga]|uniref:Uncharacterized protein n=1 Tax=Orbilia brochopaga TaxID=3140254 RepID=A0AAV9U4A8_9PEZI
MSSITQSEYTIPLSDLDALVKLNDHSVPYVLFCSIFGTGLFLSEPPYTIDIETIPLDENNLPQAPIDIEALAEIAAFRRRGIQVILDNLNSDFTETRRCWVLCNIDTRSCDKLILVVRSYYSY